MGYASGCKYASVELGMLASPANRAAAYANATALFTQGLFKNQYQARAERCRGPARAQRRTEHQLSLRVLCSAQRNAG